uniref:Peptidase A1 domain-containing protein n=1 Tax=Chlamydomonas leiostraca TaxID=1034604 RepID=A0A7S0RJ26_9CHLO|eukprot:CAMPEP_0202864412 /NCGR_PEP_ID=MMETSP1391-20130828/4657_1 /ASSEMBLY_ACC=CAM_ASM_000867 /TAXON_ID=1034604 /ORGANISM="Chlamydomonas leiostraca, Strain SAG 11-49" /LENGTH=596 /DNA_ID=CAMNT_0049544147 /DNA_START=107 /DNA_END=1897 /DNA_ORIENTATION=+
MVLPLGIKKGAVRSRSLLRTGLVNVDGAVREVGYFYATLKLGTPARQFELIIDTGSTISYVPCADCKHCGKHKDEAFDPKSSKTAVMLPCGTPKCNCGSPACQCISNKCFYSRTYAERSSSEGFLLEDNFEFPDTPGSVAAGQKNPDVKLVFGCEQQETGEIYRQTADGILGMGNNNNAFQSQLVEQKVIDDTFALCFGYPDGGAMFLGDVPFADHDKMVYTPLLPGWQTHYYTVKIEQMTVGGSKVNVAASVYAQGYGAVLDSGTTFTYLPTAAFNSFSDLVDKAAKSKGLQRRPGADPQYNDICWKGAPDDVKRLHTVFPEVEMAFGGGAVLKLRPLQYLFVLGGGSYCLGMFDNGGSGSLIGGITVRDVILQYDRRNQRAGFLPVESCRNIPLGQPKQPGTTPTTTPTTTTPTTAPASSPPSPKTTPATITDKPSSGSPDAAKASPPPPAAKPAASPPPPASKTGNPSKASPAPKADAHAPKGGSNTTQQQQPAGAATPPPRAGRTGIIVTDDTPHSSVFTPAVMLVGAAAIMVFGGVTAFIYRRQLWAWIGKMTAQLDAQDEQELVSLKTGQLKGSAGAAKGAAGGSSSTSV